MEFDDMSSDMNREHAEALACAIMRLPGLFIVDHWWRMELVLPVSLDNVQLQQTLVSNIALIYGLVVLLIPVKVLRQLYTHFVTAMLLILSHFVSEHYIRSEEPMLSGTPGETEFAFLRRQLVILVVHVLVACTVHSLLEKSHRPPVAILGSYALPVLGRIADFPVDTLSMLHSGADALQCMSATYYVLSHIPIWAEMLTKIHFEPWFNLLELFWNRLFVPLHFLLFWSVRVLVAFMGKYQSVGLPIVEGPGPELVPGSEVPVRTFPTEVSPEVTSLSSFIHFGISVFYQMWLSIAEVCVSPVSLVATSVAVTYGSWLMFWAAKKFMKCPPGIGDQDMHSGWTEGIILILLSIQTSLTTIDMPGRAAVLEIIMVVIMSSLFHSLAAILEPLLLSLGAQRRCSIRPLFLSILVFTLPLAVTISFASKLPFDFWMAMVLSSCVLTSVQVLGALSLYALFMFDGRSRVDGLDDMVYLVRGTTGLLEFLVAAFIVGKGVYDAMFRADGDFNWLSATILLINCYFNVWQRLRRGWRVFLLRRVASRKVEALPSATTMDIVRFADVCCICYAELTTTTNTTSSSPSSSSPVSPHASSSSFSSLSSSSSSSFVADAAKCSSSAFTTFPPLSSPNMTHSAICRTPCRHLFHRSCLRRWFYVQDHCPMCHTPVAATTNNSTNIDAANNVEATTRRNDHDVVVVGHNRSSGAIFTPQGETAAGSFESGSGDIATSSSSISNIGSVSNSELVLRSPRELARI